MEREGWGERERRGEGIEDREGGVGGERERERGIDDREGWGERERRGRG